VEPDDFDWSAIDKNQMGDLMIIFSKKYFADGTFDKYKCRIVFRGDRWQNTDRLSTYSSSMEEDAFKLMVGVAATEDLNLFALDVKTAFLHGIFPNGIEQWVRSPYGVPANLLPRKFRLGKCIMVTRWLASAGMSTVMPHFVVLASLRLSHRLLYKY
jgi:hypothetical protein